MWQRSCHHLKASDACLRSPLPAQGRWWANHRHWFVREKRSEALGGLRRPYVALIAFRDPDERLENAKRKEITD